MRLSITLAMLATAAVGMSQSFFDDFNRADGGLGANYTTVTGGMQVLGNEATGTGTGNGLTMVNAGMFSAAYTLHRVQADIRLMDTSATLTYSALALGHNGLTAVNNGIFVKLQRQVAGGFSHIGIYTGSGTNGAGITTTGGNFQVITTPFTAARLTVMVTSPTTLYTGIDTNFDNTDDIVYNSTLNIGTLAVGNQVGLHTWGNLSRIDNFRATAVPEPATLAVLGVGALAAIRRRRK